jgi:hypothetical protein
MAAYSQLAIEAWVQTGNMPGLRVPIFSDQL